MKARKPAIYAASEFSISVSEKFNKYIEVENKSGHLTILGYPRNNGIGFTG